MLGALAGTTGGQATCSQTYQGYSVEYYIDGCNNRAVFHLTHDLTSTIARTNGANKIWTGLGIGNAHNMNDIDFIQLNVDRATSTVTLQDTRVRGFTSAKRDAGQDVTLESYSINGNILNARFSRTITTADGDADLTVEQDLAAPYIGGKLSPSGQMGQHAGKPKEFHHIRVSDCKRACQGARVGASGGARANIATTQPPRVTVRPVPVRANVGACAGVVDNNSWCGNYLAAFKKTYGSEACDRFRNGARAACALTACKCI